jgi:hypothetical protein
MNLILRNLNSVLQDSNNVKQLWSHYLGLVQYPMFKIETETHFLDRNSPCPMAKLQEKCFKQQLSKERIISKFKSS